ncbi:hypothetical protein J6590_090646 [Homalodisca vitripennis]|nr:hypothetical protein J6590_090646 [Homalodisca vitripennis]
MGTRRDFPHYRQSVRLVRASSGGNFTGRTQCLWVPGEISLTIVNQYVWYEHLLEGTSQGELSVYGYPERFPSLSSISTSGTSIFWRELHKANSVSMSTRTSFGGNFTGRTQCLWVPGEISLTIVNQYVWYEHLLEGTSQGELGVYEYPE